MNYANLIANDIVDSDNGICVSLWFGGCDIKCNDCQNEALWDVDTYADNKEVANEVIRLIKRDGVDRSFSVLGGEPLMSGNRQDCYEIIRLVKKALPNVYIRLWTGRTMERVQEEMDKYLEAIMKLIDAIITGPYMDQRKTTNIPLIGSDNQKIYKKNEKGEFVLTN